MLCPSCKSSGITGAAADAAHAAGLLDGWFHPSAVDAIMQWSAANAAQLQEQDVAPISLQEAQTVPPLSPSSQTKFPSDFLPAATAAAFCSPWSAATRVSARGSKM